MLELGMMAKYVLLINIKFLKIELQCLPAKSM